MIFMLMIDLRKMKLFSLLTHFIINFACV